MTSQAYGYNSGYTTPSALPGPQSEGPTSASSLKRPRPISYQNVDANGQVLQYTLGPQTQPSSAQLSFPSHSFIEQFHGTHIGDGGTGATVPTQPAQVQTPPPTRKTSARKKNQPSLVIPIETPPTIISRRMSDNDAWLKRTGQTPAGTEATPFHYTPLQITPPPPMSFPNGPLTAPVYPHSQLFWDPNSAPDVAHVALTNTMDAQFMDNNQYGNVFYTYQGSLVSPQASAPAHGFVVPPLPKHIPSRPQSARPAESDHPATLPSTNLHLRQPSTLDPSMLVTAHFADGDSLIRPSSTVSTGSGENRQPYQYQLEALQREKEGRLRKALRRPTTLDAGAAGSAMPDLRRALTEIRAKKGTSLPLSGPNPPTREVTVSFAPISEQVVRTGSPLKRQKSTLQQQSAISPLKNVVTKSVVLTIDEKGHARTEVKPMDKQSLRARHSNTSLAPSSESESESEDEPQETSPVSRKDSSAVSFKRSSTKSSPTTSNDAQEALREIVKAKKQGEHCPLPLSINLTICVSGSTTSLNGNTSIGKNAAGHSTNMVPSIHAVPHAESTSWNISPTTISDPDLVTPPSERDAHFFTATRCVCNNRIDDSGTTMIQW